MNHLLFGGELSSKQRSALKVGGAAALVVVGLLVLLVLWANGNFESFVAGGPFLPMNARALPQREVTSILLNRAQKYKARKNKEKFVRGVDHQINTTEYTDRKVRADGLTNDLAGVSLRTPTNNCGILINSKCNPFVPNCRNALSLPQ